MSVKLSTVHSQYGAPMGRSQKHPDDRQAPMKFYLERIRLNNGGYDEGGAYWGCGLPLYLLREADLPPHEKRPSDLVCEYLRASDRDDAKARVIAQYPNATFFR